MSIAESSTVDDPNTSKETELSQLSSPEAELSAKHPLQNTWVLWYFKNDRNKDWNDNLKIVAKFEFVEDFWA